MSNNNDGAPSWLTEENISAAANNPTVQKAAVSAASNPAVQQAAVNHINQRASESAPSWASTPAKAEAYAPPSVPGADNSTMPRDVESGARQRADFDASPEELKELQRYHLILRICYMITALMMSLAAALTINGASVATAFICMYVFFFAVLIFCFECALKGISALIASNFGFMYTLPGRVFFCIVICSMLARMQIWGYVALGLLIACLFGNFYVLFKFPRFDEYLRKKHYYAEKV